MLVIILVFKVLLLSLGPCNAVAFHFGYFHLLFSVLYLDPVDPHYLDKKEEEWKI